MQKPLSVGGQIEFAEDGRGIAVLQQVELKVSSTYYRCAVNGTKPYAIELG